MEALEILADFDRILDRVENGEVIRIERDGKTIGQFEPFNPLPADNEARQIDSDSP